jgi:hypothetical protein
MRRSRKDFAAVSTARLAASSQDTVLTPWAHYSAQLLDQYREQYGPADSHHTDDATDNP